MSIQLAKQHARLLCLLLSLFSVSAHATFNFPAITGSPLPPNCSGSGNTYTCTSGINNAGRPITINNTTGPVRITVNGDMLVNEGINISNASNAVTIYVSGNLTVGGYTVGGGLPNTATNLVFFVGGNATATSSTIIASIYTTGNGTINFGSPAAFPFMRGSLEAYNGPINVYGGVTGCVRSARGSVNDILLGNAAANVGGVNCASNGSTSCVNNARGGAMPALCKQALLVATYNLDERVWTGANNETKDSSGSANGPYDGQAIGNPRPVSVNNNPAIPSSNGTCGYAYFQTQNGGGAFTLDNLPLDTTAGAKTSVSFWMFWTGQDGMPLGWSQQDLWFTNGSFGFNTNNWDVYGRSSVGLANGWNHVVAVFTNGNLSTNKLYINGVNQVLTQRTGTINNANAFVGPTLQLSGYLDNTFWRFDNSYLDEVKIYSGEVSQAQVNADRAAVHPCTPTDLIAHYDMDEPAWTGATGEVLDKSGRGYNATIFGSPTLPNTEQSSPALVAIPSGTCGYGSFEGGSKGVMLPNSFPKLKDNLSITAWIKLDPVANRGFDRIFEDDESFDRGGGYGLKIEPSGVLSFFKRTAAGVALQVDSNTVLQTNQWYFVAATMSDVGDEAVLYIYGQNGTLIETKTANNFTDAYTSASSNAGDRPSVGNSVRLDRSFFGDIDELRIYNGALTAGSVQAIQATRRMCPSYALNANASGFNCVATNTDPNTGRLPTQVAGSGFNVDVVALRASGGLETSFAAASNKNVTVEFVDASTGSCTTFATLSPAVSQTVTFATTDPTPGRENVSTTINNAYRNLRCRVTDNNQSPALVRCSSDNFAVRPPAFTSVTSTGANADTLGASVSNTPALKAGSGVFSLQANTAYTNYNGTPLIDSTRLSAHVGAVQTGSVTGNFSATTNGVATGSNFSYSEVGYFRFNQNAIFDTSFTSVDQPSDCTAGFVDGATRACGFGNTAASTFLGRFIPDHFSLAKSTTASPNPTQTCGSFSYFGQPGLSTEFTVTAENLANAVTRNYTGTFARLNLADWNGMGFTATNRPLTVALSGTSTGAWSNGSATVTAQHLLSRPVSPVAPATITMNAKPVDPDGVTSALDVAVADASEFRFGRLNFSNAYGSELLPLSIVVEAQYWSANNAYQRNTLDSCSVVNRQSVVMSNYTKNLAACETVLSGGGTLATGRTTFNLSRPGAGNNGSVNLAANLDGATGGAVRTCTGATESAATGMSLPQFGTVDVTRRATFGVYKSPLIYMRESY